MRFCALIVAAFLGAQTPGVLHIRITVKDAAGTVAPVPRHALLISDNPSTSAPRRVVTGADGTVDVRLPPGNYTVESDEPFGFEGQGYQWTNTLDVPAGRDVTLELNLGNAEVGPPPPSPAASQVPAAPEENKDDALAIASLPPVPVDLLKAETTRRAGNLNPYQMSSSDFDIAFVTPVMVFAAQRDTRQSSTRGIPPTDFGDFAKYFVDVPKVLVVKVTPKMAEGFWTTIARGAAYTQGVAIPPIKHFKPGFARMRVYCGDVELTPMHPFVIERRLSDTDGVREGLYVFEPEALGPHCKSVRLVMYSEKEPQKPDTKIVDAQVIDRIQKDFASLLR